MICYQRSNGFLSSSLPRPTNKTHLRTLRTLDILLKMEYFVLGTPTLVNSVKPLRLNCKDFSKQSNKKGRTSTRFQQVPWGNSKSDFQRFLFEIPFADRVFINTILQHRKSFTWTNMNPFPNACVKTISLFYPKFPLQKVTFLFLIHLHFLLSSVCNAISPGSCIFWLFSLV